MTKERGIIVNVTTDRMKNIELTPAPIEENKGICETAAFSTAAEYTDTHLIYLNVVYSHQ